MNRHRPNLVPMFLLMSVLSTGNRTVWAQGVQNGDVTGTVKSTDGQTVPGVTVTFKSPALLGLRTVVTDGYGAYLAKGLPAGSYAVTFELQGMSTVTRKVTLGVGGTATLDATLTLAKLEESLTVTAESAPVLQTSQAISNFDARDVDTLATNRELDAVADLAPGTTFNGVNGVITVSGALPYDNVYLLDGVDVADNIFGNPENDLYINDAVEETQVITSGVSAEYGRFTGGVINAVTKKGGNNFSGSFRTDLSNPSWIGDTPLETEKGTHHKSHLNDVFQATLGGPVIKDRLWFFGAGLKESTTTPETFKATGLPYNALLDEKRIEGKLTGAINPNHTVSIAYTHRTESQTQPALVPNNSIEPQALVNPTFPGSLLVASYTGVLTPKLFAEARFSQKKSCLCQYGGTDTNLVSGSPIVTVGVTEPGFLNYHAPYFDATDPTNRDNRQIAGDLSYFLSTAKLGKHDLKAGFENYLDRTSGGNSQSPTSFVFGADYVATPAGAPVTDANSNLIPNWIPGQSFYLNWLASRGARLDITTNSVFINDKWNLNGHWSFNVGARYEFVKSDATGGIVGVNTHSFVPRLAASFDPRADGKFRIDATYAEYSGRYNSALFGSNTTVNNPSLIYGIYVGPPGQGTNFAPAYNVANYQIVFASSATGNVKFLPNLSAPKVREFTVAAGSNFGGSAGFGKIIYTWRKTLDFVQDLITIPGGRSDVVLGGIDLGFFDNRVFQNTNLPDRHYQGLQFEGGYRLTSRWQLSGNYTIQLTNDGNYEGENAGQPAITSSVGQWPEVFPASRDFPTGHLAIFQRHKVRAWTTYDLGLGRAGRLLGSVLWRYDSGLTTSYAASAVPLSTIQQSLNPGYASLPPNQTLFFGPRGAIQFPGAGTIDFALTYDIPVYRSWKPYAKFDLRNAFNNLSVVGYNTVVTPDFAGPVDSFGLPVDYIKSSNYGKPQQNSDYVTPRRFTFALGFRF